MLPRNVRFTLKTWEIYKLPWTIKNQLVPINSIIYSKHLSTVSSTPFPTNKFKKITKPNNSSNFTNNEQLFVLAQNDPDFFGQQDNVVNLNSTNTQIIDEDDEAEREYLENPPIRSQQLRTKQYADIIKDHLKNKRIKEAIDVLEVRMIKEDRVQPENYIYNLVIGACGRYGYTKKAFGLFNQMKKRGLKVTGGTYTALFNACSTSPFQNDGLHRADQLRALMLEKGYEPNATNYNAMIKAYGRESDIATAFQLVDEMISKKLEIECRTINFLLQACASDKEYGFRHALIVWHKMLKRKLVPDTYSFNSMLRCVRDCNIGDLETMHKVIKKIVGGSQIPKLESKEQINLIAAGQQFTESSTEQNEMQLAFVKNSNHQDDTPNLLAKIPHLGNLIGLNEIHKASDRLLLLGGATGFLNEMELVDATPDIKTFTQLVEVIPPTNSAEKKLLSILQQKKIKCDIDFFNILMKKRSVRFDYAGAREVLKLIKIAHLEPDIVTYGILAMGCSTGQEAQSFLEEMSSKGIRMNIQILGTMLRHGCARGNFDYILEILKIVEMERIKPNEQFLKHLDDFEKSNAMLGKSKQWAVKQDYQNFSNKLDEWREFMGLQNLDLNQAIEIVRDHPWDQFRHAQADGKEEVKHSKLRLQKKLSRHIQRIKVNKLNDDNNSTGSVTAVE